MSKSPYVTAARHFRPEANQASDHFGRSNFLGPSVTDLVGTGRKENLVIVQPDTAIRLHRKGFRLYWRSISKRGPGRPPIPVEVQALIRRFANENGCRARKVRAELEKLGFSVSP